MQNTPGHLQYAEDLWQRTEQFKPMNRNKYFLAGLALKQNKPSIALNLVNERHLYVTYRFIQLMAYTQSGNFDEACDILSRTIKSYKVNRSINKPNFGNQMVSSFKHFQCY